MGAGEPGGLEPPRRLSGGHGDATAEGGAGRDGDGAVIGVGSSSSIGTKGTDGWSRTSIGGRANGTMEAYAPASGRGTA